MDATDTHHLARRGRHRGKQRDPLGAALAVLWGLGHVATLMLLGIIAHDQLGAEHQSAAPSARSLPDRAPAA